MTESNKSNDDLRDFVRDAMKAQKTKEQIAEIDRMFSEPVAISELEERHFTKPQPIACKWCGSVDIMKYGIRSGVQQYICLNCGRKFNEKDAPYRMRSTVEQIGASLNMFYDGMSLSAIARHLDETYNNPVNPSSVYRWILKYTQEAIRILEPIKPDVGDMWVVDETVLKIGGYKLWFWDIIDNETRFLIASHLSKTRGVFDVVTVMRRALRRTGKNPKVIVSDSLGVYPDGIDRVFGAYSKHIQSKGMTAEISTNVIERFHSTLKMRTRVIRGFKTLETAKLILDGFLIHYNFFRPHMTLKNRTPAEVARIKAEYKNWTDIVRKGAIS